MVHGYCSCYQGFQDALQKLHRHSVEGKMLSPAVRAVSVQTWGKLKTSVFLGDAELFVDHTLSEFPPCARECTHVRERVRHGSILGNVQL